MNLLSKIIKVRTLLFCFLFSYLFLFVSTSFAQDSSGILRGSITDGSTYKSLFNVTIKNSAVLVLGTSASNGSYTLQLKPGTYSMVFSLPGFASKTISEITIKHNSVTTLPVILFPESVSNFNKNLFLNDSLKKQYSLIKIDFFTEKNLISYNYKNFTDVTDILTADHIQPSFQKDGSQVIKYLGVVLENNAANHQLQTLNISGLGERYNQVLLNGAAVNSISATSRAYPFALLPVEAIETVLLQKTGNTSLPGDVTGGTIKMKLKDFPDNNFFYVQVGSGFSDKTSGKKFYSDKKGGGELFSFPGKIRNLPSGFPTANSGTSFNSLSAVDQVSVSMKLNNNLEPVNQGASKPNDKLLLGMGRIINLKNNKKIGIVAYLQQAKDELIDRSFVQAMPHVVANPFPYNSNAILIGTQSTDINYRYSSMVSGVVNASLVSNKSKISFTNIFGSTFTNLYVNRQSVSKPDEDTLAHDGIYYKATHQFFLTTQLAGEHALGAVGKFKLEWHATYTYRKEQTPDERSFLLRQDSLGGNAYQIAHVSAPPFDPNPLNTDPNSYDPNLTNSGRLWRNLTENNYEGAIDISTPFNLFHQAQFVKGGVYLQGKYRVFYSDLLSTTGNGYYTLNTLLAPENYASGNTIIKNYYTSFGGSYSYVFANNRGNYNASANVGAAYLRLENKFTKNLSLQWGARIESSTQLVSNIQYDHVAEASKPILNQLDKNNFVSEVKVLPSAEARYNFAKNLQFTAGYFRSVNRPQLQELTSYRYYDPVNFTVTIGNPYLQNALASNYNTSISWLPNSGTSVSVSGFYKRINQPIENVVSAYTTASVVLKPYNMPLAIVYGLSADFKLSLKSIADASLLSDFYVFGNASFISTKVKRGYVRLLDNPLPEHTLSGSPDYTFNGGVMFQKDGYPSLSVIYSGHGDYVYAVGYGNQLLLSNGNSISSIPDYRIKSNQQVDIQISQKLLQSKLQLIAGVKNVLNTSYTLYQDLNGNKKFDEPLQLQAVSGKGGYYASGVDNTITNIASKRNFYFTVSYTF